MRLALAAAIALALSTPVFAGPVCQFMLPETTAQLDTQGIKYLVLEGDKLAEFLDDLAATAELKSGERPDLSKVTSAILAIVGGEVVMGLVINGCLTPPQPLASFLPEGKRSGYTPTGIYA